ncbi:MAG: nicotinate (nicotinamide) nucleotide adenylyltransferase [bacterium]
MRNPENPERWGILGGSFDPTHNGHLHLANQMLQSAHLDGVLFVPAYQHPFKNRFAAAYDDRVKMLRLAIASHSHFEVCEIEREENLPGHTLATVMALKKRFPQREFFFIMGEDNIPDFDRWHQPEQLLRELVFLVGGRPPHEALACCRLPGDRMRPIEMEMIDVSSTDIRRKITEGRIADVAELVPPSVHAFIVTRGLYR